jgi:hypothetical protein
MAMNFWQQNLTKKVAGAFLILSLLSLGVVGGVAFLRLDFRLKKQLGIHLNCIWGENEKLLKITQSP